MSDLSDEQIAIIYLQDYLILHPNGFLGEMFKNGQIEYPRDFSSEKSKKYFELYYTTIMIPLFKEPNSGAKHTLIDQMEKIIFVVY